MSKDLVVYFSKTGNNEFIAKKLAKDLGCPIEEIHPVIENKGLLLLTTKAKIPVKISSVGRDLALYDRVILCGPIWAGEVIAPIKSFVRRYYNCINELVFVSCCGTPIEARDQIFGHGKAFKKLKKYMGSIPTECIAFPVGMVLAPSEQNDSQKVMKVRLDNKNFGGLLEERYNDFVEVLQFEEDFMI